MTAPDPGPDPPPLPPVMPDLDDCCGQGCDPCIFDVYDARRERYLAALKAWQARQAARQRDGGAAPTPPAAGGSAPSDPPAAPAG